MADLVSERYFVKRYKYSLMPLPRHEARKEPGRVTGVPMKSVGKQLMPMGWRWVLMSVILSLALGFAACTNKNAYIIDLMPSPDIYLDEEIDPFSGIDTDIEAPYFGMLYATDRNPVADPGEPYYANDRGFLLRLGNAGVAMGEGQYTWEEARQISLLKNRGGNYPLKVTGVDEIGVLDLSLIHI